MIIDLIKGIWDMGGLKIRKISAKIDENRPELQLLILRRPKRSHDTLNCYDWIDKVKTDIKV